MSLRVKTLSRAYQKRNTLLRDASQPEVDFLHNNNHHQNYNHTWGPPPPCKQALSKTKLVASRHIKREKATVDVRGSKTPLLKFANGHYDTRKVKLLKGDSVLKPTFFWSWRPLSPVLYCGVGNNHWVIPRCYASQAAVKIFQETDSRPVACQHLQRRIP